MTKAKSKSVRNFIILPNLHKMNEESHTSEVGWRGENFFENVLNLIEVEINLKVKLKLLKSF